MGFDRHPVRFALPFAVQCLRCKDYAAKNTRHNAHKETLKNVLYCGVEVYRFLIKCKTCQGMYTLVSDPENRGYRTEDACFRVDLGTDEKKPVLRFSLCERISEDLRKYEELKELKRRAARLASVDLNLVITATRNNQTVQEIRRQQILKKLEENDKA